VQTRQNFIDTLALYYNKPLLTTENNLFPLNEIIVFSTLYI